MSDARPPAEPRSILDADALRLRLDEEAARVRRSGGFLSLALFHAAAGPDAPAGSNPLERVATSLRRSVRLEDVLARHEQHFALVMLDTSAGEAARAAERLLGLINKDEGGFESHSPACAGVATAYGEVEGGGAALIAAAEEALREAAPGQFAASRTMQGRPRLLVVDDDRVFAEALAETIAEREWEAHPCTDVADARQRVQDTSYSGFFIDVVLPTSSGVEILREAMAAHPGRPAVLMSGKDVDPGAILEALSLGPVMFIRKPMSHADLDSALAMFRQLVPGIRRRSRRGV
jgi:PleD family two-component response regulator